MAIQIIIMVLCLLMSGYFSATETAFLSVNKTKLKTMVENGNKRAALVLKLSDKYDRLISTILIGNNIVNILLSSIGTILFIDLLWNNQDLGSVVSTVVCTVVVLVFGEITPKNLAKYYPESFAMFSAPIIRFISWILLPLNFIFSGISKLVALFKPKEEEKMSQEELLMFVEEVQQEGSIDDDEGDLLRNAIEFTDRKAEDILTHRIEIEAIPFDATKDEIAETFSKSRFSRLLVLMRPSITSSELFIRRISTLAAV